MSSNDKKYSEINVQAKKYAKFLLENLAFRGRSSYPLRQLNYRDKYRIVLTS